MTESGPPSDASAPALGLGETIAEGAPPMIAGRYELLGLLGSGAMGTVYRARDRELDEVVALKLVKKELAATPGTLERFRREVKLARRVTHRNVARTFDIGEHGGDRFLSMELIEGELLGNYLARHGRLPADVAIRIARDVCGGLAAAHAANVLHRDLKPGNVIIARDGRAVITDFGIARAVVESDVATATGFIGTPSYMAPEQVEGVSDLDARVDLYALGAMLYELLTGKLAWSGESVVATAAARLLAPPPDPRVIVPTLAPALADVVLKLMARRREDRFATAEAVEHVLAAIELPAAPAPSGHGGAPTASLPKAQPSGIKSVAVLPLLNLGDATDAYLVGSVTDDLIDGLSVVPALRIRPRGATAGHDSATRDVRGIGRELGVDVVVDGSLRRIGELVRVSVRLVTVEDGFQLWAQRFDRAPAAVLAVADEATAAVARALVAEAGPARAPSADAEAQDLFMRGRYLVNRAWFEVSRGGIELLRSAYARAPADARIAGTFALALARQFGMETVPSDAGTESRDIAERAIAADPTAAEARVALAMLLVFRGDISTGIIELRRALARGPNDVQALDLVGRLLTEAGDRERGVGYFLRALEIEPSYGYSRYALARVHALAGDWDAAADAFGERSAENGDRPTYYIMRARLLLWRGPEAEAEARALLDEVRHVSLPRTAQGAVEGTLRVAIARTLLPELRIELDRGLPMEPMVKPRRAVFSAQTRAELLLASGEDAEAIAMIQYADANGLIDVAWLDGCPLITRIASRPELAAVRANVVSRARRVIDAFDGPT